MLVLDDGMKGLIRLEPPHKEVWFEVEEGSRRTEQTFGRAGQRVERSR